MTAPVHLVPLAGSGRTRCCDRPPFELPSGDRITERADLVTCEATS